MASTAFAYEWDDLATADAAPIVAPVERVSRPAPELAADEKAYFNWHQQQFDRIAASFGEPEKVPAYARLPLQTRMTVVLGGALIGWAVPIAIASALVR